ncbi:biliverdin-producing heme oxygenase [Gillisia sp. M10.2A]|uniref:Biliverdin-producing heme oxygenase n=1 Tax=Gillisia lutea TaxID=2909668 RepID=A0ABS9EIQ0_9FLAO|nr:biliverdin-producing heme oxygenase [Gillisia lutea]MCF4102737.1 biliverdin-producing heme oxygenase [Gillisia lutea]
MLSKLREATHQLHKEIEKDNLADLIISHEITLDQYKKLLLQNHTAYRIVEAEITKYIPEYTSEKTVHLQKDLDLLELENPYLEEYTLKFKCTSVAQAIGARYVIEGSSLGGIMIATHLKDCANLQDLTKHNFFNGDRDGVMSWNKYCKDLKKIDFTAAQEKEAIQKAMDTFNFFGKVFREI